VPPWLPNLSSSTNFGCSFVIDLGAARKRLRPGHLGPPRIAQLLTQAERFQRQIDSGEAPSRAYLARAFGLTRARVTQLLNLLSLHPTIRQAIRELPAVTPRRWVTERKLRPLTRLAHPEQLRRLDDVAPDLVTSLPTAEAGCWAS